MHVHKERANLNNKLEYSAYDLNTNFWYQMVGLKDIASMFIAELPIHCQSGANLTQKKKKK